MLISAATLLVGAGAGWALETVFHPATLPSSRSTILYATVSSGSVGGSINVEASATWASGFTARNHAAGTVTWTPDASPSPDDPGSVLYTVDLRPVVVAEGAVPSFRDLSIGMTGPDISQLESLLRSLGRYDGALDSRFTPAVQRAVVSWHRSLGSGSDGTVDQADIVYVPVLPARIALDPALIAPGLAVSGGEAGIRVLAPTPDFSLVLADSQADVIPPKAQVALHPTSGAVWKAQLGPVSSTTNGVTMELKPAGSSAICADRCDLVKDSGTTLIPATVTTSPAIAGLTVPTAAIETDASNRAFVVDAKGHKRAVRVLGSSNGISVVSGLTRGMRVRVWMLAGGQ